MRMPGVRSVLLAAFAGVAALLPGAVAAVWQNASRFDAPPTLTNGVPFDGSASAFAANGDIVLAGQSYASAGYQIVRLAADGTLRWSVDIGAYWFLHESTPNAIIATDDGGAFVALRVSYDVGTLEELPQVARIGPLGDLEWIRGVPAEAILAVPPDRIAAAGCGTVSMLDAANGDALWQVPGDCFGLFESTLAVDENGTTWATTMEQLETHVVSISRDGAPGWDVLAPEARILGVSGGSLYLQTPDALSAVDAGSGVELWSEPLDGPAVLVGASRVPIVADVGTGLVQRLAPDTGLPVWSAPIPASALYALDEDRVLAIAGFNAQLLDIASGDAEWSSDLSQIDALGNALRYFDFGGETDGSFVAFAIPSTRAPAPPSLQRIALDTGIAGTELALPDVAQGAIFGSSARSSSGAIAVTEVGWANGSQDVRTRSIDPETGATRWERIASPAFGLPPNQVNSIVGISDDAIATVATASIFGGSTGIGQGAVWVGTYDLQAGDPRWQIVLRDPGGGALIATRPVFDSHGDVLVDIGARTCASCGRRTLYKLSGLDGHVIWQSVEEDVTVSSGTSILGSAIVLDGDDVILRGPLYDHSSSAALRYVDGASGALRWTSTVFARDDVASVIPDDEGVLVVSQGLGWARLDAATGEPLWIGPAFAAECRPLCQPAIATVRLPGGDVLAGGDRDGAAAVTRLGGDGSGEFRMWRLDRDAPALRSFVDDASVDAGGGVWLDVVRRSAVGPAGLTVLAGFDASTGRVLGQQVLNNRFGDFFEPILTGFLGNWLGGPENGRLAIESISFAAPEPGASGSAMLDTTPTAHGNLELLLDSASAAPGTLSAFDARVAYAGDAAVAGVKVDLYLPWGSGARDVQCTSACALETRGGNVLATLDLAPGDVVHITGTVPVLFAIQTAAALVTGVVFGPPGLVETDTLDNFAAGGPRAETIFADGFDG